MSRDRHEEEGVDTEARWVKKGGRCHFGYKRHTVVNQDGLIIAEETTPANESGIKHLCNTTGESELEARRVCDGRQVLRFGGNRKVLSRMKLKSHIMHKARKNRKLTGRETAANKAISKVAML